jgi:hypothetical protein
MSSPESTRDQSAHNVAVASVRRHSMDTHEWKHAVIGELHQCIGASLQVQAGDLVIASGFLSSNDWWAVTTRRVAGVLEGAYSELDPRFGIEPKFGHFKGSANGGTEVAEIRSPKQGLMVRFRFETKKPSMAPIYACMFWSRATGFHHADSDA